MVLRTIALTGASGMLGRHVAAALEGAGFDVISLVREARNSESSRCWDLRHWKSDYELDELFDSVDAIIHAGAAVPNARVSYGNEELFNANVRAPVNLAEWARRRGLPIVFVSGAIVYANPNDQDITENALLGWSGFGGFYGLTKMLAEDLLRREKDAGLKLAVIRPSSIYGYGLSNEKIICAFLSKADTGGCIELTEPVNDSIDFIHAADVADAVVKILQQEAWETFNLASGYRASVEELAKICISIVEKGSIKVEANPQITRPPIFRFGLNCNLAVRRLAWSSQVNMEKGIRALFEQKVIVAGQT